MVLQHEKEEILASLMIGCAGITASLSAGAIAGFASATGTHLDDIARGAMLCAPVGLGIASGAYIGHKVKQEDEYSYIAGPIKMGAALGAGLGVITAAGYGIGYLAGTYLR